MDRYFALIELFDKTREKEKEPKKYLNVNNNRETPI